MPNHEGLPVAGYRPQSDEAVAAVNLNKELEERVLRQISTLKARLTILGPNTDNIYADQRWLAIAQTQIEQGFMALNRAIFKPERVSLPEDPKLAE